MNQLHEVNDYCEMSADYPRGKTRNVFMLGNVTMRIRIINVTYVSRKCKSGIY